MHLLPTLTGGLVRCIYIDRLDKLSEGIGRQFREGTVPLYPLNKLPYILCLLFMFMDLLLQILDLGFEAFFTLVLCSGTPFSSINFRASITSCFFSFGIAMLHLLKSVYTHYTTRSGLFSI